MTDIIKFPAPNPPTTQEADALLAAVDLALDEFHDHGKTAWRAYFSEDAIEEQRADMLRALAKVVCFYHRDFVPSDGGPESGGAA